MNPQDASILSQFGLGERNLIAIGGESAVYALGRERILRLPRARGPSTPERATLRGFLDHLAGRLPFATPEIIEIGPEDAYTIERRLPGRPLSQFLKTADHTSRDLALRNYIAALDAISALELPEHPYGHVVAADGIHAEDWRTFIHETLSRFLSRNRLTIAREIGDPYGLFDLAADMIAELPLAPARSLVHGDYFPGNVLIDDRMLISAVLDFGAYTVVGDPVLDHAVAALTLELIDESTAEDAQYVRAMVVERYGERVLPALRFYRAYLAFSMADPANSEPPYPKLYGWSLAMLKLLAAGQLPP
jgi:aminoglycoside phosphotransferase (APT) family kinase protein